MKATLLLIGIGLGACSVALLQPNSAGAQDEGQPKGTIVTLDGLQSWAPGEWAEEPPSRPERVKQFRLEPIGDDKEKAEVIVYLFKGRAGTVEANIKRWKGMFLPPEGKKIDDVAKVETMKVGKVPVTYVDVNGTYQSRFPPFDPNAKITPYPNYRMIGVIFESDKGPYYIRFLGPANTVAHYKKGFDDWLKGFK
jgi:hypothetical protein